MLESYRYDLWGTPTYYDALNTQLSTSNYSIVDLYAGERWVNELRLYAAAPMGKNHISESQRMENSDPEFYLASSEGYGMEQPRGCWRLQRLATPKRDDLLLIKIDPPVPGQKDGLGSGDLDRVLVATRHEGASLFPINEWPVFVHVARLLREISPEESSLGEGDFESIAWAELYRSKEEAGQKGM